MGRTQCVTLCGRMKTGYEGMLAKTVKSRGRMGGQPGDGKFSVEVHL